MKFVFIFLFFCINISYALNTYSQSTILSIHMENKSMKDVFREIEKNSEFIFIYKEALDLNKRVTIKAKNENISNILDKLFKSTDIQYIISDRQIALSKKNASIQLPVQQSIRINGTVSDDTGETMPGVNVVIKRTGQGVVTDINGEFSMVVPSDSCTLEFRYIGYITQEIVVGNRRIFAVTMKEASVEIGEVTIVAFGKQKKESVVGAISTIQPSELIIPSSNLTNSLAGRVAGLISYQRSGEPGRDNSEFFIRGVMTFGYKVDPLILIDNVEVTTTDLARMQPDDIASFSIMKDATATALYGARGANGVILITTKSGREGEAKVNFRIENSVSQPTRNLEFADAITYMELHNEAALTRNPLSPLPYHQSKIDNTIAGVNPNVYPVTDWRETLMKDYTMNQRVNLSVSGGGKVAQYYVSGGYTNDNGILKVDGSNNFNNNIKLNTYSLRSNVNIHLTKTTELVVRMNGSFDDYTGPLHGGQTMYNMVVRSNPVLFPAYYPASHSPTVQHIMFGSAEHENGSFYLNPYAEMVRGYKEYSRSNMLAQLELNQKLDFLAEGLSFRTMMNTNRNSYFDVSRYYIPFYYHVSSYDRRTDEYRLQLLNEDSGTQSLSYSEGPKELSSVFYLEAALNYNRSLAEKHSVSGLLVYTMRQLLEANAGDLQLSLPQRNIGLAGRTTYSYDSRYFVEFNFGYILCSVINYVIK